MRFMMLMIPKVYQGAKGRRVETDFTPSPEASDWPEDTRKAAESSVVQAALEKK